MKVYDPDEVFESGLNVDFYRVFAGGSVVHKVRFSRVTAVIGQLFFVIIVKGRGLYINPLVRICVSRCVAGVVGNNDRSMVICVESFADSQRVLVGNIAVRFI